MTIPGKATPTGTLNYLKRHSFDCAPEHFREVNGLVASSIGLGTYLGKPDKQTDALVAAAVFQSVQRGVNLIDTAINYRYQHGEWSVREGIRRLMESSTVSRDEIIICTKGGFIPLPFRTSWHC